MIADYDAVLEKEETLKSKSHFLLDYGCFLNASPFGSILKTIHLDVSRAGSFLINEPRIRVVYR